MDALRYAEDGHAGIQGWLDTESAVLIALLSQGQVRRGISGSLGEIGVHHGKLFILLDRLRTEGEGAFAVDVFGDQQLNVDRSGRGNRAIFLANVARYGGDPDTVQIFERSSEDVTSEDVLRQVGPVRLLSVDGGHTEALTLNDLTIAEGVLSDGGILVLDDVFNEAWPGVVSGLVRFLEAKPALVPFAVSPNKTYLCRPDFAETAMHLVEEDAWITKHASFLGYPVTYFKRRRTKIDRIKRAIKSIPVVRYAIEQLRSP